MARVIVVLPLKITCLLAQLRPRHPLPNTPICNTLLLVLVTLLAAQAQWYTRPHRNRLKALSARPKVVTVPPLGVKIAKAREEESNLLTPPLPITAVKWSNLGCLLTNRTRSPLSLFFMVQRLL